MGGNLGGWGARFLFVWACVVVVVGFCGLMLAVFGRNIHGSFAELHASARDTSSVLEGGTLSALQVYFDVLNK